mmetsp:Transcript_106825/g.344658  ORF Transcript_106825/g.344658 Transcript_106825/m.344658 type:complete len:213 (+) Transcript_106825:394-1032(+)
MRSVARHVAWVSTLVVYQLEVFAMSCLPFSGEPERKRHGTIGRIKAAIAAKTRERLSRKKVEAGLRQRASASASPAAPSAGSSSGRRSTPLDASLPAKAPGGPVSAVAGARALERPDAAGRETTNATKGHRGHRAEGHPKGDVRQPPQLEEHEDEREKYSNLTARNGSSHDDNATVALSQHVNASSVHAGAALNSSSEQQSEATRHAPDILQ